MIEDALGEADQLQAKLHEVAASADVQPGAASAYGQRYVLDFDFVGKNKTVRIRCTWIVRNGEDWAPGVYEVEFSDDSGRTYAVLALTSEQLMRLHHEPVHRAA